MAVFLGNTGNIRLRRAGGEEITLPIKSSRLT
jgi:hypothetical protein